MSLHRRSDLAKSPRSVRPAFRILTDDVYLLSVGGISARRLLKFMVGRNEAENAELKSTGGCGVLCPRFQGPVIYHGVRSGRMTSAPSHRSPPGRQPAGEGDRIFWSGKDGPRVKYRRHSVTAPFYGEYDLGTGVR